MCAAQHDAIFSKYSNLRRELRSRNYSVKKLYSNIPLFPFFLNSLFENEVCQVKTIICWNKSLKNTLFNLLFVVGNNRFL